MPRTPSEQHRISINERRRPIEERIMVRSGRTYERLIALFLLGVLLLLPPILLVFNRPVRVLGVPLLYIYVFAAWALLIALAAAITRQIAPDDAGERKGSGAAADERQAPVERARDA